MTYHFIERGFFNMDLSDQLMGFFHPEGIAVFGSMREDWFFGASVVVKELQSLGYKGTIYPVNPGAKSVYGLKVYPHISKVEGKVDLAVIITSCKYVPEILRSCGRKGIKAVVVVSDGFAENGQEGKRRQDEIVGIARENGIRIIGPNTLGIYSPSQHLSTIPYEKGYNLPPLGGLSIVTQTGMYGPQAVALNEYRFGINTIMDLGNMCDVDEVDCLKYLEQDVDTRVIALYIENIRRPGEFLETARRISQSKPILCLKGGRAPEAASAMASHTGTIAGSDNLYDALFRQAGVIRVEEYEDLLDCPKVFLAQDLPKGNRLGVISLTGAIGIQCIDAAAAYGLMLGGLNMKSKEELFRISTTLGTHPIDLGPASASDGLDLFSYYQKCFDVLMEDENIDCIYLNTYISSYLQPEHYEGVLKHMGNHLMKPVVSWSYGPSSESVRKLGSLTESHGIPFFPTTHKSIKALGYLVKYARWRESLGGKP